MQVTAALSTEEDLLRVVKGLEKQGRLLEALARLREGLRRGQLDAEGFEQAGRMVRKAIRAGAVEAQPVRVLVLGQFTTSWLCPTLGAVAWGHGSAALVDEGGFDTILQDLSVRAADEAAPDVVLLLPWNQRLLGARQTAATLIESELDFWRRAWNEVIGRLGARLVQVSYDWVNPGPLGYGLSGQDNGLIGLVEQMNAALRRELPAGAYFLDLGQVSGTAGRSTFYDMRRYHWTKQPFGEDGLRLLAEHLWAGIRAVTMGPKKVLVLDLDNTLWGGVVGETGPLGVALGESPEGEAYRSFQQYLKGLAGRGVILAIASKNNLADAVEVFEKNPDMVLRLDDFGAYEICWEPKSATIARLAETLNLGLDSFVYFDDNPAEREQVRQALTEVEVVEVPEDPAEYTHALASHLDFETFSLTDEDRQRTTQYVVERKRRSLEITSASLEDYLVSLKMVGDVRLIDQADLPRVIQLLAKTNQFNLTTRRHSREVVLAILAESGTVGATLRLRDRFGDHGLVAVMIVVPHGGVSSGEARIDTWLMSCRVISRTAEQFLLNSVCQRCRELGYRRLVGEYIPTKKNVLVASLYPELGFVKCGASEDGRGSSFYVVDLDLTAKPTTFISTVSAEAPLDLPAGAVQ